MNVGAVVVASLAVAGLVALVLALASVHAVHDDAAVPSPIHRELARIRLPRSTGALTATPHSLRIVAGPRCVLVEPGPLGSVPEPGAATPSAQVCFSGAEANGEHPLELSPLTRDVILEGTRWRQLHYDDEILRQIETRTFDLRARCGPTDLDPKFTVLLLADRTTLYRFLRDVVIATHEGRYRTLAIAVERQGVVGAIPLGVEFIRVKRRGTRCGRVCRLRAHISSRGVRLWSPCRASPDCSDCTVARHGPFTGYAALTRCIAKVKVSPGMADLGECHAVLVAEDDVRLQAIIDAVDAIRGPNCDLFPEVILSVTEPDPALHADCVPDGLKAWFD